MADHSIRINNFAPPWVYLIESSSWKLKEAVSEFKKQGGRVVDFQGVGFSSEHALFESMATSLSFPGYFGKNWDALADCLGDLHPHVTGNFGILLRVSEAHEMLKIGLLDPFIEVACQAGWKANLALDADGIPTDQRRVCQHVVLELSECYWSDLTRSLEAKDLAVSKSADWIGVQLSPNYW
ncbi:barstar family protein [Myceligenerans crystallogenes]